MKSGFVNIFGKPNAGKSTLLNALMGEKLAIVSPKVQTTRHRIKGILTNDNYQIIFSDTPGIIEPKYKLHEKMMQAVKGSLEDADVALLIVDIKDDLAETGDIFSSLKLKVPAIVVLNKADVAEKTMIEKAKEFFLNKNYCKEVIIVSALKRSGLKELLDAILLLLPEGEPFYQDEIPYHATVLVQEFKEKATLTKISADIILQRETQKGIVLGERGNMIKQLGTLARKDIEEFIGQKVFLELFVKVRPKWRDNEMQLREYGY
jgi:GTP-binding protein Era